MIEILSGYLTLVLGITTGSILVLQYLLAKRRWRLDLYDKRYPVYLATMQYLSFIALEASVTLEELIKFLRNSKDKEFLFGKDIQQYLDQLYRKGTDLKLRTDLLKNPSLPEPKRQRLVEEQSELLSWFSKQSEVVKEHFGEYLKINKK
jgi:hypothetical protein